MGPLTEARICVELWVNEAEPSARCRQPRLAVGRVVDGDGEGAILCVFVFVGVLRDCVVEVGGGSSSELLGDSQD